MDVYIYMCVCVCIFKDLYYLRFCLQVGWKFTLVFLQRVQVGAHLRLVHGRTDRLSVESGLGCR